MPVPSSQHALDARPERDGNPAKFIVFILLMIVGVRLLTLGAYPLGSTTEPRYAEIARKMLETGNWVTPWFDHGVPFWGKPPLSFWASTATMGLLGVNEFAVRLAPFLAAICTAALFWAWPSPPRFARALPVGAAVVMLSTVVGFIAAAAVMTDMFMTLGTTLCMVAFWISANDTSARTLWRWVFFVGLAIGLLAKGPVATVITGLALFLWLISCRQWRTAWRALPWGRGMLLTAGLTLPWYLLAEARTPGFLQYFIIGEHLQRFLVSGWTGDLYGQGHAEPRGLIWWFGFGGFLPWTLVALLAVSLLWRSRRTQPDRVPDALFAKGEWQYLVAWTLAPLLFFTVARNILEAYVMPGLPAFALLTTVWVLGATRRTAWLSRLWWLGLACPLLFTGWLALSDQPEQRSHRALLRQWRTNTPLVYLGARPLSANFYSLGQAKLAETPEEIRHWLGSPAPVTLVVQDAVMRGLAAQDLVGWQVVVRHAGFTLLQRSVPVNASEPSPQESK